VNEVTIAIVLVFNILATYSKGNRMQKISHVRIGNHLVGPDQPVFIVAEIGINHNGDVKIAKRLIDLALTAGVQAVKLQTRTIEVVYNHDELAKPRPIPKAMLENAVRRGVLPKEAVERLQNSNFENSINSDLKRALEFTDDELREIDCYCREKEILWFTSCWDIPSVTRIERTFSVPCHKIASPCNADDELLRCVRRTGKPVILSTGMTNLTGVQEAVEILERENLIILHCTSVYPKGTEAGVDILRLVNLRGIETLRESFGVPVGFSSHDSGIMPSYAAAALGAVMIEKHITLERSMWGSDHGSSLEPIPLINLCRMVKELHIAMGNGQIVIYPDEEEVARKLRRVRRNRT